MWYNLAMSSNDRYRGNREYRDLTVQTHYGKGNRNTRVQTKRPYDSEMKFSRDSADFRRPYEDQEFIARSRAQTQRGQVQGDPARYYAQRPQQPQQYQQSVRRSAAPSQRSPVRAPQAPVQQGAPVHQKKTEPAVDTSPKVSREQALQIDMVFKIGIMLWGAAALVITIVLLTR
ncbi:MAG: hypothetical protein K6A80_08890 [Saccharofermentans sp.]|nr:hypothetical protein [Saccharofermentans sp.]